MRRSVVAALSVLVLCFGAVGWMKVVPRVRRIVDSRQADRQAALREAGAEAAWKREFGDPERALAEFPAREDDATAVRLIALARSAGISLSRPQGRRPVQVESPAEAELRRAVAGYVEAELTRTGGEVAPPPAEVRAFLDSRRRQVGEIVDFLTTSEPPAWKSDVSLGPEAPVPNVLPQLHLQRLLLAEALDRARRERDLPGIERVFDASWLLNASLRDRADVISQLIAISIARSQAGLARRLPVDPEKWRARFSDHDYRSSLLRAMEVESVSGTWHAPADASPSERVARADFLDVKRSFLAALRDGPVSDGPIGAPGRRAAIDSRARSDGGIAGMLGLPTLAGSIRRADRLVIDTELTLKVLQARALRDRLGSWPEEIPNVETTRMARGRWNYSRREDGGITISFSRELEWPDQGGMVLPTRYDSEGSSR